MVHPAAVRCFHGPSSCYYPSNFFLFSFCHLPLSSADRSFCRLAPVETMFNHTVSADSFTLRFFAFLPNVVTESLKANVRVCVCVSWIKLCEAAQGFRCECWLDSDIRCHFSLILSFSLGTEPFGRPSPRVFGGCFFRRTPSWRQDRTIL